MLRKFFTTLLLGLRVPGNLRERPLCVIRTRIQEAVVECPDGMVYFPLEVTQGVPPFGGVNGLDDFIAAGCDGTNSTCVVRIHMELYALCRLLHHSRFVLSLLVWTQGSKSLLGHIAVTSILRLLVEASLREGRPRPRQRMFCSFVSRYLS